MHACQALGAEACPLEIEWYEESHTRTGGDSSFSYQSRCDSPFGKFMYRNETCYVDQGHCQLPSAADCVSGGLHDSSGPLPRLTTARGISNRSGSGWHFVQARAFASLLALAQVTALEAHMQTLRTAASSSASACALCCLTGKRIYEDAQSGGLVRLSDLFNKVKSVTETSNKGVAE
ncbi:hypothetical protein PG999_003845 [Apiospora kogelbergensis]|uniref:Uncharacterized protein n=1 Tax=Apiospora kogelbergensis TaxID=1337665 RepID=A0AAW0R4S2_9PEZI